MKVLTATHATQGQRANDFDWCVDGELVMQPTFVCGTDAADPDGGCGCGRSWAGLNSHRATTTAVVADLPLSLADYVEAVRSSLEAGGWWPGYVDDCDVQEMVVELLDIAEAHPVGVVLEKRLAAVASREP